MQSAGQTAEDVPVPLPVRGILEEAQTAEVNPAFAATLQNWRSDGASIEFRQQHTTRLSGLSAVQRIPFEFGGRSEYIEITNFEVHGGNNVLARSFVRGYSAGAISSNVIFADGNGNPLKYDGATIEEAVFTTTTGVDPAVFDGFIAHQDRPFFWASGDDLDFYYGDVGAITGSLTQFPLSRLGNITGTIFSCQSVTVDAGQNVNDVLAVFTSTGQVVTYVGTNPSDASEWSLQSRLQISPPVSREAFVKVGGDTWMLSASGIVSVNATIASGELALVNSVSEPIQQTLIDAVAEGGDWQMHRSADARMIIINRVYNGAATQFIYNTQTRGWETATYPARRWHNLGKNTQFTDLDGFIATLDKAGQEQITAIWESTWLRLGQTGITYLEPNIIARGNLTVKVTVLTDFDETLADVDEAQQTVTLTPDNPLDAVGRVALNEKIGCDAVGNVFQIRMEITATWAKLVSLTAGVQ